jgi:hypothetical protein
MSVEYILTTDGVTALPQGVKLTQTTVSVIEANGGLAVTANGWPIAGVRESPQGLLRLPD